MTERDCLCSDKKAEMALELKEEVEQLRKNAQKLHQEVCGVPRRCNLRWVLVLCVVTSLGVTGVL